MTTEFNFYGRLVRHIDYTVTLGKTEYGKLHIKTADDREMYVYILMKNYRTVPVDLCKFTAEPLTFFKSSCGTMTVLMLTGFKVLKKATLSKKETVKE